MIRLRTTLLAFFYLVCICKPALAQEVKSFAVLPFTVNGADNDAHLAQSVEDILNSHLTWAGHLQPVDKAVLDKSVRADARSKSEVKAMFASIKADFIVYGSMTIAGDDVSLDIEIMDNTGSASSKSAETKLNRIIPTVEIMVRDLNAVVFKRANNASRDHKTEQPVTQVNQMNPNIVVDQNVSNQQVYLNPNFRYSGNTDAPGSWRSQSLPFTANGMAIGDLDGNGSNTMVLISDSEVHVYRYVNRQLLEVGKWTGPPRVKFMRVSVVHMSAGDKKSKIVVTGYFDHVASSTILSLANNKLVVEAERLPYYLAAVKLPPRFESQLVGSRGDKKDVFTGGVYEMSYSGGKLSLGAKLSLPRKANPFNFAFLPETSGYKLVMVDDNDHLAVHSGVQNSDVLATTEERFAGSSFGIEHDTLMSPMNVPKENDYMWNYYYVPLPLVVAVLGNGKKPELLVSKNISIASQFFENFRYFSQGEIHSLEWDGVGLNLKWKTRRIKGTIVGYDVAGLDTDNISNLVVCINTYAGATGLKGRRTLILAYPIDLSSRSKVVAHTNIEGLNN